MDNEKIWELIREGQSQRQISAALNISRYRVAQAGHPPKTELAEDLFGLPQNIPSKITRIDAVSLFVELATRPQGVKFSEMVPVFGDLFGYVVGESGASVRINMTDRQRDYLTATVKAAAMSTGKVALIVPEWMPRQAPLAAYQALIEAANALNEAAQEALVSFIADFPEAADRPALVMQELLSIAFRGVSREPVETRCRRNLSVAEQLEERGTGSARPVCERPSEIIADTELETICT